MRINHIAMYVKDIEKAKDFFVRYFDGESGNLYHNKKTGFRSYFISFKGGSRLEIMTRPEIAEPNNTCFRWALLISLSALAVKKRSTR